MQARVPIRAIDPPADPVSSRPAHRRDGRPRPPYPVRVLLVEDDRGLAHSLRLGLEELGLSVHAVGSGRSALDLLLGWGKAYEVVVLDVQLPGVDGFEVCRRLRDGGVGSPVLLLTARDASDDRIAGSRAGADGYMVKPFALHELAGRVRMLARRARGGHQEALVAGPLVLEPDARLVRVGGRPVQLTGKEFDLLEHFMLQPSRVIHQARLLDTVWSYEFAGGRNLVEVYMGRLRRKLAEAGMPGAFTTVRGAGYRFNHPA